MTVLEAMLAVVALALWLALIRLHAEVVVLRRERDDMARHMKALTTVYRRGVDKRGDHR